MVRCAVAFLLLVALAAGLQAQEGYAEFMADFKKAQEFKDDKLLDKSLQSHPRPVIELYCSLAREWRNSNPEASDKARAQMDLLLASWKRVFKGATLDHVERYFARMDSGVLKQLDIKDRKSVV